MTSNTRSATTTEAPAIEPTVEARAAEARQIIGEVVTRLADGEAADPLALLEELTATVDGAQAAATHATKRAQVASAAETVEGMSLQRFLTAVCGLPYGDAGTLVTVGEVLADMPHLRRLFDQGAVSSGTVRKIVYLLHRKRRADRTVIDDAIADATGRIPDMDPDELYGAVSDALDRHRNELAEAREQRAVDNEFLALQPRLDGTGGSVYGEYGPVNYELVSRRLNQLAHHHRRTADDDDGNDDDGKLTMAQARARGLLQLCLTAGDQDEGHDGGDSGGPELPDPDVQLNVVVDIDQLAQLQHTEPSTLGPWGQLVTHASAQPVQLTQRTLDRLAGGDPTVCAVFRDGAELLGISKPTTYIPDTLRTAVQVRDGHDRAPGSSMPATACDIDHVTPRTQNGTTELHNLTLLNREAHRSKDNNGPWRMRIDPDGITTWRNRHTGRQLRTLPRLLRKLPLPHEPPVPQIRARIPRNRGDP